MNFNTGKPFLQPGKEARPGLRPADFQPKLNRITKNQNTVFDQESIMAKIFQVRFIVVLMTGLITLLATGLQAGNPNTLTAEEKKAGWVGFFTD